MEEPNVKPDSKKMKWLKLFVKIVITVACLWWVSRKIDFYQLSQTLLQVNWLFLAAAVVLYMISKVAAAFRLNIYFKNIHIPLSHVTNLKLYWLGLFYNLFLPGSISGDAYKVIYLSKKFGVSYKKTTAAVILDRLTGLLGLVFVLAAYGFLVLENDSYSFAILVAAVLASFIAYWIIKKWFADFLPGFWSTFLLGLVVQLFSNSCAYMIMLSLGIEQDFNQYIFIFLVASIAAVLPLTLGGLGAREIVFLELSKYFGLVEHTSVLIGFLIYITVVISSAGGMIYVFIDPMKSSSKNEIQAA
jgi:glycosyltransferase 2 family protein